jgi:phenylpyruvate tautomerase PptA (4-oxalocrotonate tautomerase family)
MPFLNIKVTTALSEDCKASLTQELLDATASAIGKPKNYIMMSIEDNQSMYFAGQKMSKCAYVMVSLYGNSSYDSYNELCHKITEALLKHAGIPKNATYVSFHPTDYFGFNGGLF